MTSTTAKTPFIAAGDTVTASETRDGDILIEGWAAVFSGLDRQNENFSETAFSAAAQALARPSGLPLLYHHKRDHVLGQVLDLRVVPGKGLWLKARVDAQPTSSPLAWIVAAIKRGSIRSLSVGGVFKRLGQKIIHADLIEISTTAAPVHEGTGFAVVQGKALGAGDDALAGIAAIAPPTASERIAWLEVRSSLQNLQLDAALLSARTRADALTL